MRSFVLAVVLLLGLGAGTSLPASAEIHRDGRDTIARSRPMSNDAGIAYQRIARATINDSDEDYRPGRVRSTYDADDSDDKPRYVKRRHTRSAKHYKRSHRVARKHTKRRKAAYASRKARRNVAHASRRARTAATPSWTKRSLSNAGPVGSGQLGVASYYWQPQRVAAGGWFNPNAMTAAHKTLPFGTRVRVTHLGNGRSVEVKINDRGPYVAGRIIDLSKAAAGVLGMQSQGIARVQVTVLGR
ncbi:MAG: septal ring lytic transglycosylase RlpA family protein [Hyphomicrobiaceae bacterium]|nr:MAG: septal ring lytic transglycosylase RlpA family protein [Hyphomicrobiaceae bacterium]